MSRLQNFKMFEQFNNYLEIKWTACAAAQAYSHLDKLRVTPDLDNFKLERFKDLRKQPKVNKDQYFKLMLIGSSKTNIFIDGPDSLLDEMIIRLPKYIGKTWVEIQNMRLERDSLNCKNYFTSLCDPQVIGCLELKPLKLGESAPLLELDKADQICAKCKSFEFKLD